LTKQKEKRHQDVGLVHSTIRKVHGNTT